MTDPMPEPVARWDFQRRLPGRPNASGDITRLFNTGDSRPPRSFSRLLNRSEESSISAAIYGREGIANCVDASLARSDRAEMFSLEAEFRALTGQQSIDYWDLLDLSNLAGRAGDRSVSRKDLGLGAKDCLSEGREKPLRLLTVRERFGGGMPGGLDDPRSVLVRALLNVGEAQEMAGAAGSYGFGKAAVAQASRIRVVLAYTCAPAFDGDPVTRRLLGVTYWGMHDLGSERYTGWALYGRQDNNETATFEDDKADQLALQLGLDIRDPEEPSDQGTTFVLIEPTFGAADLVGAIEVFWWPLLQQSRSAQFKFVVRDEDGNSLTPQIDETHPELGQFVRTFRRAEDVGDEQEAPHSDTATTHSGDAGVTALEKKLDESPIEGSLVAKMRSPLMVVAYESMPRANPPLVGVFVSHESTNENLRRVEPPEHDKWHARNVGGLNATSDDLRISRSVRSEIDDTVNALRAPDPPPVHGIAAFSKFFPAVDVKAARPRPPRPKGQRRQRLVRVHLVHDTGDEVIDVERPQRHVERDGRLRASAEVRFFLDEQRAKRVGREFLDATITIGAKIDEDGSGGEWLPAEVEQRRRNGESTFKRRTPAGVFPSVFEGRFHIGENIHFVLETSPYEADWTIELNFDCSPWDVPEPTGARSTDGEDN